LIGVAVLIASTDVPASAGIEATKPKADNMPAEIPAPIVVREALQVCKNIVPSELL
jgi:hypothetical protein